MWASQLALWLCLTTSTAFRLDDEQGWTWFVDRGLLAVGLTAILVMAVMCAWSFRAGRRGWSHDEPELPWAS